MIKNSVPKNRTEKTAVPPEFAAKATHSLFVNAENTRRVLLSKNAVLPGDLQTTFTLALRKLPPAVSSLKLGKKGYSFC